MISCECHKSSSLTEENLWCIMKVKSTYPRQISFVICSVPCWVAWGTSEDVDWSQVSKQNTHLVIPASNIQLKEFVIFEMEDTAEG